MNAQGLFQPTGTQVPVGTPPDSVQSMKLPQGGFDMTALMNYLKMNFPGQSPDKLQQMQTAVGQNHGQFNAKPLTQGRQF